MFLRILDRLEEILIASLIAAATLIIFVAVVQRFAVGVPLLYPYLLQHQPDLGAGTVHLHVHLDGQVRCRLWRAHGHPCRCRRARQYARCRSGANEGRSCSRFSAARFSPRSSALWVPSLSSSSYPTDQVSPDLEMPSWIVYLVHAAGLLLDVLPFPAGGLGLFLAHR